MRHALARKVRHAINPQLSKLPTGSLLVIRALKEDGDRNVSAEILELISKLSAKSAKGSEQMMRSLLAIPVRIYQAFSSVSSPRCKYYPSCSNYAITAVRRYGVKGVGMAAWRLVRCNPWSHGGIDYVDEYLDSADARKSDKKEVVGAL